MILFFLSIEGSEIQTRCVMVEVNPFLDTVGSTQSTAVMIILEFLGAIFDKKG